MLLTLTTWRSNSSERPRRRKFKSPALARKLTRRERSLGWGKVHKDDIQVEGIPPLNTRRQPCLGLGRFRRQQG
jgi:hypothetical protein